MQTITIDDGLMERLEGFAALKQQPREVVLAAAIETYLSQENGMGKPVFDTYVMTPEEVAEEARQVQFIRRVSQRAIRGSENHW